MGIDSPRTMWLDAGMTTTTADQVTYVIEIAPKFWDDHIDRGCTPALASRKKGKKYVLTLDDEGMRDLYSDAVYYGDPGDLDSELFGLSMSARSVVKAIRSQHPEWVAEYKKSRQRMGVK